VQQDFWNIYLKVSGVTVHVLLLEPFKLLQIQPDISQQIADLLLIIQKEQTVNLSKNPQDVPQHHCQPLEFVLID
jgi:hypothetical protein